MGDRETPRRRIRAELPRAAAPMAGGVLWGGFALAALALLAMWTVHAYGSTIPLELMAFGVVAHAVWRRRWGGKKSDAAQVWIGSDGISVDGKEFVPYARVVDARTPGSCLVVQRIGEPPLVLEVAAADRDEAVARIRAAVRAHAAADPAAVELMRRGRDESIEAWRARIGALASPVDEPGYREATLGPERLWRVLEDPAAHPTARVAAAEVLRVASTAPERRARIAALDDTAHPKVRVALEELAEAADVPSGRWALREEAD